MTKEDMVEMLKAGKVEEWNAWRKNRYGNTIDLARANLSGARLSEADLSEADLTGADLSEVRLGNVIGLARVRICGAKLSPKSQAVYLAVLAESFRDA